MLWLFGVHLFSTFTLFFSYFFLVIQLLISFLNGGITWQNFCGCVWLNQICTLCAIFIVLQIILFLIIIVNNILHIYFTVYVPKHHLIIINPIQVDLLRYVYPLLDIVETHAHPLQLLLRQFAQQLPQFNIHIFECLSSLLR